MSKKLAPQGAMKIASDGSLAINWLGHWASTDLMDLAEASWTIEIPIFRLIESLLRSVSSHVRNCQQPDVPL